MNFPTCPKSCADRSRISVALVLAVWDVWPSIVSIAASLIAPDGLVTRGSRNLAGSFV